MFKKLSSQSGFSLIEISVLLMIISLISIPLLKEYYVFMEGLKLRETEGNMETTTEQINNFVQINNRYPVPASFVAILGDADYGVEGNAAPLLCSDAGWETADGMCLADNGTPADNTDDILIGAVPFQALGLEEDLSYDYWNRRILYAVSLNQTNSVTYTFGTEENGNGAIRIQAVNANGNVVTIPNSDFTTKIFDMILISHGNSQLGGYDRSGSVAFPCDTTTREGENCDFDFLFTASEEEDRWLGGTGQGTRSFIENANFYDDLTNQQEIVQTETWFQSSSSGNHAMTTVDRIGIGTTDPEARVHVIGNVIAEDRIISSELCNNDGTNCVDPEIIAGTVPQMDCSSQTITGNLPVVRVANSRVYCAYPEDKNGNPFMTNEGDVFTFPTTHFDPVNCDVDTGGFVTGIVNGRPTCAPAN